MDEIIIVDTGSSDRTKEKDAKYTDKLYDFRWNDDFSAARNFAFSKASCDYIYSADADEVIDAVNAERFRILKQVLLPEVDVVQMIYTNQLLFNTTYNYDEELRPKLYKRLRSFVWEDPLHEAVRLSPIVYDSDIKIMHCPTSSHQSRDFLIYQSTISKGGILSEKLQKMYARELFIAGDEQDFLTAEPYFAMKAEMDENHELILMNSCVLMKCSRLRGDSESMLRYASRVLAAEGTPSEAVFELGEYYRMKRDYREAIMWYYNAAFETESILNGKYHDVYPLLFMHLSYTILGDVGNAALFYAMLRERR